MHMNNNELKHYGVKGMRWGVRRATKQLSKATTKEAKEKAIGKLQKHKSKAQAKVAKLNKQRGKLEREYESRRISSEQAAAEFEAEAAKKRAKKYGIFVSEKKAAELEYEANKLMADAAEIRAKTKMYKQKIESNKVLTDAMNRGISEIDKTLAKQGRKYING